MVKQTIAHRYHEVLLRNKKATIDSYNNLELKKITSSGKASLQRLYSLWFHFSTILEMTKLQKWRIDSGSPGVKEKGGGGVK